MSLFFRCPLCNRRHFGACPLTAFVKAYADAIASVIKAKTK